MRIALAFITLLLTFFDIHAQDQTLLINGKITGKLLDAATGAPVEYATIALLNGTDSSIITGTVTNSKGDFSLTIFQYGTYNIKIDFISYKNRQIKDIIIAENRLYHNLGTIILEQSARQLSTVEVAADKGEIQLGIDKNTYNVSKDLTTAGGTANDVLQNLPSVIVDMNGTVSLRGSSNIKILIDGKPSNLTGSSRSNALEQLPASSIESVEVITNPSAKYDADGMAGIINIITKKQKLPGLNGLFSLSAGTNGNVNLSSSINYGYKKFNFFGGYDLGYYRIKGSGDIRRKTLHNDTLNYLDQKSIFLRKAPAHIIKGGFDLIIDSNNSITFSTLYRTGSGVNDIFNEYFFLNQYQKLIDRFDQQINELSSDKGIDVVISYEKELDKNAKLTADLLFYRGSEREETIISGSPAVSNIYLEKLLNNEVLNNYTAQIDYTKKEVANGTIEVGWKYNIRDIRVDAKQMDRMIPQNEWIENYDQSNYFKYYEEINAVYGIYNGIFHKFNYQVGLRAEHTGTKATLVNSSEENINFYNNFFPSAHISRAINDNSIIKASYSRRINRPGFWNLNPYIRNTDPYNQWSGNPYLKPEKIGSYELGYTNYMSNGSFSANIYYRSMKDVMSPIRKIDGDIALSTIENLATGRSFGTEVVASGTVKIVRISGSINLFKTSIDAGKLNDAYDSDYFSYMAHLSANLKAAKGLEAQMMINYRGPMSSNQMKIYPFFFADLAMKKSFMGQKASLGLRISDIFNSFQYKYDTTGEGMDITGVHKRNSTAVMLTMSYKLNNYQFKERKSSDQDLMNGPGF